MKQKALMILTVLLFVVGIGILLYPLFSDWYNDRVQATVIEHYDQTVKDMDEGRFAELWEAARTYNRGLEGNVVLADPFKVDSTAVASKEYDAFASMLSVGDDGVIGYVRIPKIDVRLPVYRGSTPEVLEKGAGHVESTSLPTGDEGTHTVISAHTGLPGAVMFTDLDKLETGDMFFLEVLNETLAYRVDQVKVVEPADTRDLVIDSGKDYVTLVTCTPYGINSHRLLVRGVRIEYTEALAKESEQTGQEAAWKWPYIIAGSVFVLILVLYTVIYTRRTKKKGKSRIIRAARTCGGK